MKLPPYLLDEWLSRFQFADPPIRYDLAASTGPHWTVRQVLNLLDDGERERLLDSDLIYCHGSGTTALREAIAAYQCVGPEDVQIVTGAIEALLILFFLAAEPGANVVVPFPGFPPFEALPRSFGFEVRTYKLRREKGFRLDPDEVKSLVDAKTKIVLVNSPHNPTGKVIGTDELRSLHDFAADHGVQFVVDEVYHPIYYGEGNPSAASLPHATVIGDFSKAFCLSGLRAGWIVDRNRRRVEEYLNTRSYLTISNTLLGEALAVAAVKNREVIFDRARQAASTNLGVLDEFFREFSHIFGWVRPEGGMTCFPWLLDGSDSRELCERLAAEGLLLAPGDSFSVPNHFRFGFGAVESEFPAAIEQLRALIGKIASRAGKISG